MNVENKFLAIYCNQKNTDCFVYGKIIGRDQKMTAIQMVAPSGQNDGFLAVTSNNIYKTEDDVKYNEKMCVLMNHNKFHENHICLDEDITLSFLKESKTKNKIISIEIVNSGQNDFVGIVQNFFDDSFEILEVNEYGEIIGNARGCINDITQISLNSEDEKILEILLKNGDGGDYSAS